MINNPPLARLLGLADLINQPSARVLVVATAAARSAASELLPDWAVITWPDSGEATEADYSPLNGRQCFGWRPAGAAWVQAMGDARTLAVRAGAAFSMVRPPDGVAEDWNLDDASAEGWDSALIVEHIEQHADPETELWQDHQPGELRDHPETVEANQALDAINKLMALANHLGIETSEVPPDRSDDDFDVGSFQEHGSPVDLSDQPFKFLGHNRGVYYYLSKGSRQVVQLAAASHSKTSLIYVAGLEFWTDRFAARGKDGFSVERAIEWMFASSHRKGVYEPGNLRGRGAWWDNGRSVMHCGDRLIVDGRPENLDELDTKYIYESGSRLDMDISAPLNAKQANRLITICEQLNFEKPIQARFLAGHVVLSLIGGALQWRPHIYIVGESGAGKSWVMREIIGAILDSFGLNIGGDTTEAAVRQALTSDALPVIFDDTDKDSRRGRENMEAFLGLIRTSSSDGRSRIMKGGANGTVTAYDIRSCFILASIGLPVTKQADATRITVLTLERNKAPDAKQKFAKLESETAALLTADWIHGFQARAIRMIPTIRINAKIFAAAAAAAIGTQRLGDQFGALLAGAYSLYSDNVVTPEQAAEWVAKQDWRESQQINEEKDHSQLVRFLAQTMIRTDGGDRTISDLIWIARDQINPQSGTKDKRLNAADAFNTLRRYGIVLLDAPLYGRIAISNSNVNLAGLLRGTDWAKNWGRILRRVDQATARAPAKYADGGSERGVVLPIDLFLGGA